MAEQSGSQPTRRQYIQTGTAIASVALAGCATIEISPTRERSQSPSLGVTIRALSADDGRSQWTVTFDDLASLAPPRIGSGLIYLRLRRGVTAVGASDGSVKWSLDVLPRSMMEADGSLYVLTADTLYAVNARRGTRRWTTELPGSDAGGSPSKSDVPRSHLALAYGGTPQGNVYVGTKRENGGTIHAFDITDGAEQWRLSVPSYADTRQISADPQLSIHGSTLYAKGTTQLTAVDVHSKTIQWTTPLASEQQSTPTSLPSEDQGVTAPVVSANRVYTAMLSPDPRTGGSVIALDRQTGAEQWRSSREVGAESAPRLVAGRVVVRGDRDLRSVSTVDGSLDWSFTRGILYHRPAVQDATVYLGTTDQSIFTPLGGALGLRPDRGHIYAVDARTGNMKWRTLINDRRVNHLCASDGSIYAVSFKTTAP